MQPNTTQIHAFRLRPGQDLRLEIEAYARRTRMEAGWVVTCVGSLTRAHLRLAGQQEGMRTEGPFEIVALVGTVSLHGCHLHVCISDSRGITTGGHLLEGNLVYTTAEIILGETRDLVFTREADGTTAWKELQIAKK
jgi:uncharacterized protein